jgi:hypothetical protein
MYEFDGPGKDNTDGPPTGAGGTAANRINDEKDGTSF